MLCAMTFVPLSDDELARAALGAHAMAFMHEQKVERSENPDMHAEQVRLVIQMMGTDAARQLPVSLQAKRPVAGPDSLVY
jgi:hypothetical protein